MKYQAKILSKIGINHGFFDKEDGFSKGDFSSLNVSYKVGDDSNLVRKNREKIASEFNLTQEKLLILDQIHSTNVIQVTNKDTIDNVSQIAADALITKDSNIILGITTADCLPLLLYDNNNKIIASIHAGWRGAFEGIIENTIQEMKKISNKNPNIFAAIGPCIHQASYEVDDIFYQKFIDKHIDNKEFFSPNLLKINKYYFNLPKFVYNKLIAQKIKKENIENINLNTYLDKNNFFSHRKSVHENRKRGLQISCITL